MIDDLAQAAGIAASYTDYFGNEHRVSAETKRAILNAMGYGVRGNRDAARLLREIEGINAAAAAEHTKVASPPQAYVPPALDRCGVWGFALQLYSLRSRSNWGIGDFSDLAYFSRIAADLGAQAIALNPLHQLHLSDPARASPYSPLSRLHLNAMYIDVEAAARMLGVSAEVPDLHSLRDAELIEYTRVADAKIPALRAVYERFRLATDRACFAAFRDFQRTSGTALRRMAVYEALAARFKTGWLEWPSAYRRPRSAAVNAYERANLSEIEFYEFLQWLADAQLASAAAAASQMSIGLYRDLAIGVDAQSADVWADRDAFCLGISAGAPPDALNANGQNWGLPPMNPRVLRERAYSPFIAVLRANMRHAGALRIDHVMGLMRLFVIPDGAAPSEGAYVAYPFDEMAGVLAQESVANRCMVVGEDLGTLPYGFRERMAERRFFSCRLLYFERSDDGAFCDPQTYPHDAVASTGTHDLPPFAGFWHGLASEDRMKLLKLLGESAGDGDDLTATEAAYRALARTSAALLLLQMEDALVQREAVNVPGTTTEAPNWRRKLTVPIEMLKDDKRFATIVAVLQNLRPARIG